MTFETGILRQFEPENPAIIVPRTLGWGWEINLAAVAVKFGLIRPDDSLPDLAEYLPPRVVQAVELAPVVGAAVTVIGAVAVGSRHEQLPTGFTADLRPRKFRRPVRAMLPPVALAVGAALWAGRSEPQPAERLACAALATGIQTMTTGLVLAAGHSAQQRKRRSWQAGAAIAGYPLVAGAISVVMVKLALKEVRKGLSK